MPYIVIRKTLPQEFYHYGKKGMHWGVINNESPISKKSQKREAKALKFDNLAKNAKTNKKKLMYEKEAVRARAGKLSRRQRQVIVGASIVAAYATYKLVDSGEATRLVNKGKAALAGRSTSKWNKDQSLADKNLSAEQVLSKVVSRINPDYGKPGTTNNCRRCTFAYIKARQGYDVVATKSLAATGQTNIGLYNAVTTTHPKIHGSKYGALMALNNEDKYSEFSKFLGNEKRDIFANIEVSDRKPAAESIFKALSKMPNNSSGELAMNWDIGGGHSMAWEVIKGKPVIFDCQSKTMYDTPDKIKDVASRIKDVTYSRLDNVEMDETMLGRWMTNAKR